jgi:hypothetical protein
MQQGRKMNKIWGFLLIVLVAGVAKTCAGSNTAANETRVFEQADAERMVQKINSDAPIKIADDVFTIAAKTDGQTIDISWQFRNVFLEDNEPAVIETMLSQIRTEMCNDLGVKAVISADFSITYTMVDENKEKLGSTVVSKENCR